MHTPSQAGVIVTVDLSTGDIASTRHSRSNWYRMLGGRPLVIDRLAQHMDDETPVWVLASTPCAGLAIPLCGAATIGYRDSFGTIRTEQIYGSLAAALRECDIDAVVVTGQRTSTSHCMIELIAGSVRLVDSRSPGMDEQLIIGPAANQLWCGATLSNRQGRRLANQAGLALVASGVCGIVYQTPGAAQAIPRSSAADTIDRLVKASPLLSGPCGVQSFGWSALAGLSQSLGMLPVRETQTHHFSNTIEVRAAHLVGCVGCGIDCFGVDIHQRPDLDWIELTSFGGFLGCTDQFLLANLGTFSRHQGISPDWLATILCEVSDTPLECAAQLVSGQLQLATLMELKPERELRIAGQPLPPFDPRGAVGQALARLVSPQPGSYHTAFVLAAELLRKPLSLDGLRVTGKARLIALLEDARAAGDGVGACLLSCCAVDVEELAGLLTELFSEKVTAADLLAIGRRTVLMERRLNHCRDRLTDPRSQLPAFLFEQPGSNGQPPLDYQQIQQEWHSYEIIRREQEHASC